MYKYVLFDLDGTLTDSAPGIINCIKYACDKMALPVPNEAALQAFVGPPLQAMMQKTFSLSEEDAKKMVALYRERFSTIGLFENSVYPGVPDLLLSLKKAGCRLALATSKPQIYAERIMERFDLDKYFDVLSGSELSGAHVDKKDVINIALSGLNAEKCDTVMVGDRSFDIEAAHALNVKCIGVTYGYAAPGELEALNPDFTASSPHDMLKFILGE